MSATTIDELTVNERAALAAIDRLPNGSTAARASYASLDIPAYIRCVRNLKRKGLLQWRAER